MQLPVGDERKRNPESGRRDLNPRPFAPQANALPVCATPRPRISFTRHILKELFSNFAQRDLLHPKSRRATRSGRYQSSAFAVMSHPVEGYGGQSATPRPERNAISRRFAGSRKIARSRREAGSANGGDYGSSEMTALLLSASTYCEIILPRRLCWSKSPMASLDSSRDAGRLAS